MTIVYCIIVTYNAEKWIYDCLSTIKEDKISLTILVIDNNSDDNTLEIIRSNFPKVRIIETGENLGFGKANNLGYSLAKDENAEYVYLLNQDTTSYPNNIFELLQKGMSCDLKIGVISPMHLNDNGSKLDALFESCISARSCKNYISDVTLGNLNNYYPIQFVNAASWLIDMKVIEDLGGLFSSAFFHYGEDINFGNRLNYFDYSIVIVPSVFIHHCREERNGKKTKEFENRMVEINKLTIMHDVTGSFWKKYIHMVKYGLSELKKGQIRNFLEIILFPVLNFQKINRYREFYIKKDLSKL